MSVLVHSISAAAISTQFPRATTSIKIRVSPRPTNYYATSTLTLRAELDTDGPRRRLVDIIRTLPDLSKNYFRSPSRRALFGGISLLGGFYVAQTISLSFGALGVNDVIAAVLCVLVTEYVTKFYYSRPKWLFFSLGSSHRIFYSLQAMIVKAMRSLNSRNNNFASQDNPSLTYMDIPN